MLLIRDLMRLVAGKVIKMIEYRMIPLLFSCVNIGDELSAAAITKGLGGKAKRTSVAVLKIGAADLLLITGFTGAATLFVIFKYFV